MTSPVSKITRGVHFTGVRLSGGDVSGMVDKVTIVSDDAAVLVLSQFVDGKEVFETFNTGDAKWWIVNSVSFGEIDEVARWYNPKWLDKS